MNSTCNQSASHSDDIADSGEGYASKQKAKRGLESVKENAPDADVVEDGPANR